MKRWYLTLLAFFFLSMAYSQNNQVVISNGRWNNNSTWTLGHTPANGETAIIPADSTLIVDDNILISTSITLKVYGTLNFQVGKLRLTGSSAIYVYPGGNVTSDQGNASDKIEINGVTKYSGEEGTLSGPLMANSATSGFETMPIILPVKFVAYNVLWREEQVSVNWSATGEENAAYYEVERSTNGSSWQLVGKVPVLERTAIINDYAFTDKKNNNDLAYYRIKQVDKDGYFIYSSIRSVRPDSSTPFDIKVSSIAHNVVVEFTQQLKTKVIMRLTSLSGQIVAQQTYTQPGGYVIFKQGPFKGHYILSLDSGEGIKIARHVFLN